MSFDVVVWNMAHKTRNWARLLDLHTDIVLVNEATPTPEGLGSVGSAETHGRDGYKRPWAARVVSSHPLGEISDAAATRYGRTIPIPFENSRPGSWAAATVVPTEEYTVTAVSLYGLMDEKSDASVHRSLSELTPLFEDQRYNQRLVLGGDLNTWTGWGEGSRHLARDGSVLDRIRALGLVDCLEQSLDRDGPLEGCTCSLGDDCRHSWTRLDPRYPDKRYQMDYLFSSSALAERLQGCIAFSPEEWKADSDHSPILATFEN